MSKFSKQRGVPVQALVGVVIAGATGAALWQQWAGGYSITSTYGGLGGGWWEVTVLIGVVAGLVLAGVAALALRFLGVRRMFRWVLPVAVVACLGANFAGAYAGSAQHEEDARVKATSCDGGVRATMKAFADAARPDGAFYIAKPEGTPEGCMIDVTIPRRITTPFVYVERRVADVGFRRTGETAWTDEKGTTITMRLDEGDDPEGREYFAVFTGLNGS